MAASFEAPSGLSNVEDATTTEESSMKHMKTIHILLFLGLALSACGEGTLQTDPIECESADCMGEGTPGDFVETSEEVPTVAAQMLGLYMGFDKGHSPLDAPEIYTKTITAEDLDGDAFVHLNFTAPVPLDQPFDVGLSIDSSAWKDSKAYTTAVVGATTMRDANYEWSGGLQRLIDLSETVAALGGEERMKRIVAASPMDFLVEDVDGEYWPVGRTEVVEDSSGVEPLASEEMQFIREKYAEVKDANNNSAFADVMSQNWQVELDALVGEPVELTTEGITAQLSGLTQNDGNLDIGALKSEIDFNATSAQLGSWEKMDRLLGEGRQAHMPAQRYDFIGVDPDKMFDVPRCTGQIGQPPEAKLERALGCGPAAFVSLAWREWAGYYADDDHNGSVKQSGVEFYDMPYRPEENRLDKQWSRYKENGLAARMAEAVDRSKYGRSDIQEDMNSCWFVNGTLTHHNKWRDGANKWLKRQHDKHGTPRMRVKSNVSYLLGNIGSAGKKARMLRDQMKKRRKPAVAGISNGIFSWSHYSPVHNYRTRKRCAWFVCWRQLQVQIIEPGYDYRWFNMSAGWVRDASVHFIERY